ncbi:MAG: hypothetical protein JWM35_2730 [Verrucomicrobia bacterium]|nr:hypothetical protein [Verrucomicrobiota bacterium]
MPAAVNAPAALPFAVEFGRPDTVATAASRGFGLGLDIPVLAGDTREILFPEAVTRLDDTGLNLVAAGDIVLGCATERVASERALAAQAQELYRRVLESTRGRHLYRIWNYVPRINALTDGFENYRAFCQGRSLAFEAAAGAGFPQVLPSASAVGTNDRSLSVVFVAGSARPHHFENPEQVPAYRYPAEHGPRPPSFSRATVAALPGRTLTFISGTAAIKGHHTVAPGTLDAQLDCTLDNLRLISQAAGLGENLGATVAGRRFFKIYLRHPRDLTATRARLEHTVLQPADHAIYLHADICRAQLNVEIEISVIARAT